MVPEPVQGASDGRGGGSIPRALRFLGQARARGRRLERDGYVALLLRVGRPLPGGMLLAGVRVGGGWHLLPKSALASQALNFIPLLTVRHQLPITHKCSMLQIHGA